MKNVIYSEDCLIGMSHIPNEGIDMILSDLPYKETGNKWDKNLNLKELFNQYERIIKAEGAINKHLETR